MKSEFLSGVAGVVLVVVVGMGAPAIAAAKDDLTISNVQVEIRDGMKRDGKKYLKISLDALVNKKLTKGMDLAGKVACLVGTKRMAGKAGAMVVWHEIEAEETKHVEMPAFITEPLDSDPTSCDISLRWGKMFGGDPKELGKYCWTPEGVKDGACPKAK